MPMDLSKTTRVVSRVERKTNKWVLDNSGSVIENEHGGEEIKVLWTHLAKRQNRKRIILENGARLGKG